MTVNPHLLSKEDRFGMHLIRLKMYRKNPITKNKEVHLVNTGIKVYKNQFNSKPSPPTELGNPPLWIDNSEDRSVSIQLSRELQDWRTSLLDLMKKYPSKSLKAIAEMYQEGELDFFTYWDEYVHKGIEVPRNSKQKGGRRHISANTKQIYDTTKRHLQAFYEVYPFNFETINLEWRSELISFLREELKHKNSTINITLAKTLAVMKRAKAERVHNNEHITHPDFTVLPEEQSHEIALSPGEIEKILNTDFTDKKLLESIYNEFGGQYSYLENIDFERIKLAFCLMCNTGSRYDEYSKITKQDFVKKVNPDTGVEVTYFKIWQTKNDDYSYFPLNKQAREILEQTDFEVPKLPSNQKTNDAVKIIGWAAGITQLERWKELENNVYVTKEKPRWQFITTHTGRRSACTNMWRAGVPIEYCMLISGHKKLNNFMRYIRASNEERVAHIASHPYFN